VPLANGGLAAHPSQKTVRIAALEAAVDNVRWPSEALVEPRDAIPSACPLAVEAHISTG
jgi:hypothetical protein